MGSGHFKPLLAGLSLALIGLLVVLDRDNVSPGPLSAAHQNVPELSGQNCDQCHGNSGLTLAQSCNVCHEAVSVQLASGDGFHGSMSGAEDCGHCHTEHFGMELPLVGERAFALAGIENISDYAHEGLGFELLGRHGELACQECHANALLRTIPEGEQRYMGLSQDCATCHNDPHDGQMAKSCHECHGQELPFTELANFLHTSALPLDGVHADVSCNDCHDPASEYAVEQLGTIESPRPRQCADCHSSPHSGPFLREVSLALEVEQSASCSACHSEHGSIQLFEKFNEGVTIQLHGASGFELEEPHAKQACFECHTQEDQQPRRADDCAACHVGPHGDQFVGGPFGGSDCLTCHDRKRFLPSNFRSETHVLTGFELEAGHGSAQCADCHGVPINGSLGMADFTAAESTCSTCHLDVHGDSFLRRGPKQADCDACHRTTSFADVLRDEFDHEGRTGFDLSGAHGRAECEACHVPAPQPDSLGRRFGRVLATAGGQADSCNNCHANVHVGRMASHAESCANCHNTTQFNLVITDAFDHGTHTGFELLGAHGQNACESCHTPDARAGDRGREFGFASEAAAADANNCSACHADPHRGMFRTTSAQASVAPRSDCGTCHNQDSFSSGVREQFDHEFWTGFPLQDAHAQAGCNDCHQVANNGTLGPSRGRRCSDCHEDAHHGQLGAAGCARCHSSALDFHVVTFDHRYDSDFVLDELHQDLACSSCHQPWPLASGGSTVRYKPLASECVDCHKSGEVK